jgi:hypothetical protein
MAQEGEERPPRRCVSLELDDEQRTGDESEARGAGDPSVWNGGASPRSHTFESRQARHFGTKLGTPEPAVFCA